MNDIEIELDDQPGALAAMGETLARAGVSVDGGGVFVTGGRGVAHFLFADGEAAREALERGGIRVRAVHDVVIAHLRQDVPGQLGAFARRLAEAGVNIEVQYSDHDHRLILVVDDPIAGRGVSDAWAEDAS